MRKLSTHPYRLIALTPIMVCLNIAILTRIQLDNAREESYGNENIDADRDCLGKMGNSCLVRKALKRKGKGRIGIDSWRVTKTVALIKY